MCVYVVCVCVCVYVCVCVFLIVSLTTKQERREGDSLPPPSISVSSKERVMSMPPTVSVLVDVESGQRAMQRAQQAEAAGANTLMELERQREVIEGMQSDLDKMDEDLDMADRHIRGVESVGGSLLNKMTSPKNSRLSVNPSSKLVSSLFLASTFAILLLSLSLFLSFSLFLPVQVRPASTVLQRNPSKHRNTTLAIVYKHANDSLEQGSITFLDDHFRVDVDQKMMGKWTYDVVESVVCRARYSSVSPSFLPFVSSGLCTATSSSKAPTRPDLASCPLSCS